MAIVYDVPAPAVSRSNDPAVLERGKHLTQSLAGCALSLATLTKLSNALLAAAAIAPLPHSRGLRPTP